MTFRETKINFETEIQRLEQEREELAEEAAAMSSDNPARVQKAQRGKNIGSYLDGLDWAQTGHEDDDVPAWDEDVDEITLSGLTGGQYGAVQGEKEEGIDQGVPEEQVELVATVRKGTVEAPYLDEAQTETQATAAVGSLPIGFLTYAAHRINELSSVGNDRKNFETLLAEKAAEQT